MLPEHIGIIMDGNGRWAQRQGKPRLYGHQVGANRAKNIVLAARDRGIGYVTLFAFSTENWKRPISEVQGLFLLMEEFFRENADELAESGVKVNVIGDRSRLPRSIRTVAANAERITANASRIIVNIALNYGGRWDVASALRRIAEDVAAGRLDASDIDEDLISSRLATAGQPDPDLIIRTGGESRISNFMLWQVAYAEIYVTQTLWPDFRDEDLDAAISFFLSRTRRYGGLKTAPHNGRGEGG
ncbi:MAG: polyprenyl diphosphate synthase [Bacillota bacterium]|nr:polyprenyl diphosphate synthase [Bacillota bacterium]